MDTLQPLLVGGHACSAIMAGHYAGLWTVLHEHPGKKWTLTEFAAASDCKERWIREWVGVMASAKVLILEESMIFSCKEDVPAALLPTSSSLNFFTVLEFLVDKEPEIGRCFKNDGPLGVGYDKYERFHEWMASWTCNRNAEENFPTRYIKEQIGNGLDEALNKGIEVIEPGCGSGCHVLVVAKKYPNSNFLAFDIAGDQIEKNKKTCEELGISNVEFVQADFTAMPEEWNERFDFLMIYDCMHDLPHPARAMSGIRRILKPNALGAMLDINTSSDMYKQTRDAGAAPLYNISLHHCMSVSLANGGVGLGACWGIELAQKMLLEAGFDEKDITVIADGMHAIYIMKKGNGLQ